MTAIARLTRLVLHRVVLELWICALVILANWIPVGQDLWPVDAFCAEPPLTLHIALEKEVYLLGEPVWVEVTLANTGPDPIRFSVPPLTPPYHTLEYFVSSDADTFQYYGLDAGYTGPSLVLQPSETLAEEHELLEYYGSPVSGTAGFERLLPVGEYEVVARTGIESNKLRFQVIEPLGLNRKVHEAIVHAARLKVEDRRDEAASTLLPLLPTTQIGDPYRERLESALAGVVFANPTERTQLARQVLEENPNSRNACTFVGDLLNTMSRKTAVAFVDSICVVSPGTRAARQAKRQLAMRQS